MTAYKSSIIGRKQEIKFDVDNPEHCKAIMMAHNDGRQHATLRFQVEPPFTSVTVMGIHKMAIKYVNDLTGENIADTFTIPQTDDVSPLANFMDSIGVGKNFTLPHTAKQWYPKPCQEACLP